MTEHMDMYSIIVLGWMNPGTHNPFWYGFVGLLDEFEVKEATTAQSLMTTPDISQFQTSKFGIHCTKDTWTIETPYAAQLDRIQSITWKLFDSVLKETTLVAVGFNFLYARSTRVGDVGGCLAKFLLEMPLGLQPEYAESGEFWIRRAFGNGRTSTMRVRSAPEVKSDLVANYNFDYRLDVEGMDEGYFELEQVIKTNYSTNQTQAESQTALIVQSINESLKD